MGYIAGEICLYNHDGKRVMQFSQPKKQPIPISDEDVSRLMKWLLAPPAKPKTKNTQAQKNENKEG